MAALTTMFRGFVHHVPSFNDLNTMPEEPVSGMHSEFSGSLDATNMKLDQNPKAAVMERTPSRRMSNKKADEPSMATMDYHEFDKHRSNTGTQRHHSFDHASPLNGKVPSVWEMIIKSEDYMKQTKNDAKPDEHHISNAILTPRN